MKEEDSVGCWYALTGVGCYLAASVVLLCAALLVATRSWLFLPFVLAAIALAAFAHLAREFAREHRQIKRDEKAQKLILSGDSSGFALYLRPFDGLDVSVLDEDPSLLADDDSPDWASLETIVSRAISMSPQLQTIALGRPSSEEGAGKVPITDNAWFRVYTDLAVRAQVIVVVPLGSGTLRELGFLVTAGLLTKTVFLMPHSTSPSFGDFREARDDPEFHKQRFDLLNRTLNNLNPKEDVGRQVLEALEAVNKEFAWRRRLAAGRLDWRRFATEEWNRASAKALEFGLSFPSLDARGGLFSLSPRSFRPKVRPFGATHEERWQAIQDCLAFARGQER